MQSEQLIAIARHHFEKKGYRVHSGLQFGCELVLYADSPGRVHSDFCVMVVGPKEPLDWRRIQTLVRSMPGLHKTLIIACVKRFDDSRTVPDIKDEMQVDKVDYLQYKVEELAIASEHAPFKHKNIKGVGMQVKPS
ncbi:hypothetical protein ACHAXN_006925 [Cyclotella atomus]